MQVLNNLLLVANFDVELGQLVLCSVEFKSFAHKLSNIDLLLLLQVRFLGFKLGHLTAQFVCHFHIARVHGHNALNVRLEPPRQLFLLLAHLVKLIELLLALLDLVLHKALLRLNILYFIVNLRVHHAKLLRILFQSLLRCSQIVDISSQQTELFFLGVEVLFNGLQIGFEFV